MYYLVYTSTAVENFTEEKLKVLLQASSYKNKQLNITGILIYIDNNFIEVLEGEEERVQKLFKLIEQDNRHQKVIMLIAGELQHRNFPDWAMGYKATQNEELPYHINLLKTELVFDPASNPGHPAILLVNRFYQHRLKKNRFIL